MKEPDLEEEALNVSMRGPELVIERQTLGETVGEVTVVSPTGDRSQIVLTEQEPGLWRGGMPAGETGLFSVTEGDMSALIHVGPRTRVNIPTFCPPPSHWPRSAKRRVERLSACGMSAET